MIRQCFRSAFIAAALIVSALTVPAMAEVHLSGRHVIILQPGVDGLWGSYLLAAENAGKKSERAELPLNLPKQTVDFRPEEGLKLEELRLSQDDRFSLVVHKEFVPGSTLLGMSFNVPAAAGSAELSFELASNIDEFVVMVPKGRAHLESSEMIFYPDQNFVDRRYDMLRAENLKKSAQVHIKVSGLPEGRQRFWYIGAVAGVVLCLGGAVLTAWTKPKDEIVEA